MDYPFLIFCQLDVHAIKSPVRNSCQSYIEHQSILYIGASGSLFQHSYYIFAQTCTLTRPQKCKTNCHQNWQFDKQNENEPWTPTFEKIFTYLNKSLYRSIPSKRISSFLLHMSTSTIKKTSLLLHLQTLLSYRNRANIYKATNTILKNK